MAAKDGEQRKAARAEEQLALQDTIKMLMSDNSLDLFRSRSPAFLQLSSQQKAKQAAALLKAAAKASNRPELNFLALALAGKKADFTKILEKIDGMVALMKQEGADDKSKKEYCEKEFRGVAAKSKSLESKMKTLAASVTEKKGAIAKLSEDIAALQSGVQALDSSVATAGSNRKAEHAEFQESTASNSAALELLSMAKNRLNKVYNPSMVAATTTKSPYDLSLLQLKGEQPPALPEGGYQTKMQESNGVMKMMDTLTNDMEKEMAVAKTEEADAQVDYQDTVKDATAKREADLALVQQKVTDKADLESDLNDDQTDLGGKKKELVAAGKYTEDLHQECDWLLKNFELRVQARTEEKENLIRAKTVLGGMYSRGRCVVGTWTKELPGASAHACVLRCEDTPGCLGVLYGEVESAQKPQVRCFLAGVGKDDVLMEYPSEVVRFSALLELSSTLQCWQKRWQCASPEPEGSPKDRRLAALLEDLQQRLQALPALPALGSAARALRQGAPGHFLLLLGGVCRVLGRAADNADLAVARCFKAAKATLEGPSGSLAVCLLIFPVFGLLGQRLRAWQRQVASWQVSSKTIDLILPREQSGYSTAGALPTLCSAGMMPLDSPDWHAQAEANSPESPEGLGCVPTPHRRMRAMTPPRRRHAPPAKDVEEGTLKASPAPPRVSVRQREAGLSAATISARDEGGTAVR
ncbi:unnamed protein product [Effrenium voratum]|nr:unnamed protein product [Effrenium voratum]